MASNTSLVGAAVLLVILLSLYGYVEFSRLARRQPGTQTETIAQYASNVYGYTFSYDRALSLIEFTPQYQTLEDASRAEPNELVQIAVEESDPENIPETFEEYIHARALVYCAADGPHGSQSCTKLTRSEPFTTATGLTGEVFYLELEKRQGEEVSRREAGPFYAFDISANAVEGAFAALVLRPGQFAEESDIAQEGARITNEVVNTLRIDLK